MLKTLSGIKSPRQSVKISEKEMAEKLQIAFEKVPRQTPSQIKAMNLNTTTKRLDFCAKLLSQLIGIKITTGDFIKMTSDVKSSYTLVKTFDILNKQNLDIFLIVRDIIKVSKVHALLKYAALKN